MRLISGEVYAAAQARRARAVTSRGRKARMGLPAKCMHFVGSPGWRGKIKITPRDEQSIRSVLKHDALSKRVSPYARPE